MTETKEGAAPQAPRSWTRTNADGSVELELEHPVEWGTETVGTLTLKRPKAKHLRTLGSEANADAALRFAAQLTEHPDALIDELDVVDAARLLEVVEGFLPASLGTGGG